MPFTGRIDSLEPVREAEGAKSRFQDTGEKKQNRGIASAVKAEVSCGLESDRGVIPR